VSILDRWPERVLFSTGIWVELDIWI